MKKRSFPLFFLFLIGLSLNSWSQKKASKADLAIKWVTFEEAVELNKKTPKKIFVDVYTPWCHWCKVMEEKTYPNKVIASYMNEHFYCVKFDAEGNDTVHYNGQTYSNKPPVNGKNNTHALALLLIDGKLSYPSLVFLDGSSKKVHLVQSYLKPEDFEAVLNYVGSDAYKTKKFDAYYETFKGKL